MQTDYWNSLAASFDEDVFDPVANDLFKRILSAIKASASAKRRVADIGCGTGRNLPLLCKHFKSVLAVDLSGPCLQIARQRYSGLSNIDYLQHDLTTRLAEVPQIDVGVCLNVAMMPDFDARTALLQTVTGLIRPRGRLILLVPAMESVLLTNHRLLLWNLQEMSYRKAVAETDAELGITAASIRDGVVKKGGTATKHYLREELELLLPRFGHQVCSIEKAEYPWHTEFDEPPESMGAPYPWDWLLVSKPSPQLQGTKAPSSP